VNQIPPCISNIGTEVSCEACNVAGRGNGNERRHGGLTCSRRRVAARQHVFMQADWQTHVYLVKSGGVRIYKVLGNGRRQIIGFKFPGDFITLDPEERYRFSAQAIEASELRSFPIAAFLAYAQCDVEALSKLYGALTADLACAHDLMLTVGQRDAEGGIAAFLLDFEARAALGPVPTADSFPLPMPRTDIADYLGLTHETVSRIFTDFRKRGLIDMAGHRNIRLLNRDALRALAEGIESASVPAPAEQTPPAANGNGSTEKIAKPLET
jgi:CRP/FNR family transcriptional regulator